MVRPGNKQTEVGEIPEDWEVVSLDAIATVTSGKRLPLGRSLTDQETPHPYIRVTDMRPGTVSLAELRYVPVDVFPAISMYRIYKDDIFISVAGTLGLVGRIPDVLDGANLTENADRITGIRCSRDFLLYVLSSPVVQSVIDSLKTVGAQPKLALARIRKFSIPLPPKRCEQDAIAEALSDADALIESLEQLLVKKHQIKLGAMQDLLTGRRRLPGFSGEWGETRLGELGVCHRGVSYNPEQDLWPSDGASTFRLLRSTNVQSDRLSLEDVQIVDCSRVSPEQQLRIGDILICMANGSRALVGKTARFSTADGQRYTFGAFMGCFRPDPKVVNSAFCAYLFHTGAYRRHVAILLAGSSINNLAPSSIEAFRLGVPRDQAEQSAIASVLSDMDAEIDALVSKLTKARQIKQGMMQQLLTGRIRLT